jgi:23S rRNA pseudouridine1911/1915/1917 synthase
MKEVRAGPDDVGLRLDIFLARQYPDFSRASLEPLFKADKVSLDSKPAKPGDKLRPGDKIRVDDALLYKTLGKIELPVLYEDEGVIVIDKPAGVLTHAKGALNTEASVASFLAAKITDKNLGGNRAGIVHRLDRVTSGVIIAAKTEAAQKYLQKQFAGRKAQKKYLAIVEGWPEPPEAIIDAPIERNPKRPQTFRVGAGGKPAQTRYHTLERFNLGGHDYAELELVPVTGRTHQIRVHLKYIGHPVVGDSLYGRGGSDLLLHASRLKIRLPSGEEKLFKSRRPKRFNEFKKG